MFSLSSIFSLIGGAYHLLIDVPVFGVGVGIGAFGYRFLLQKNPAMLQKIIDAVEAAAKKAEAAATGSASTTPAASATATPAGTADATAPTSATK